MAGAGLLLIKRRIKSVTNTKKITRAMGLVATAKLRKTRERLVVNGKFTSKFNEAMNDIKNCNCNKEENIYKNGNGSNKNLYIVLTSDTGLCGGFNSTVMLKTKEIFEQDINNSVLIIAGQKGRAFFKKLNFDTAAEYVDLPDLPSLKDGRTIAENALSLFNEGKVGTVNIVYTKFNSIIRQTVTVEQLLPLEHSDEERNETYIKFEPSENELLNSLLPQYLTQKILNFMLNSKASEQGARMTAMDGSTKNANDILDNLNLRYNIVRQGAITQEITEIVGGAEAQK
jgi:F-type H+-transporting ATPase subunit gamma